VLQKKSKILLYFLCGIAIPCLLLSYFAYRGIQNDRAIYEQQMLQKNQQIAGRIVATTHSCFSEIELRTASLIASLPIDSDPLLLDKLHSLKNSHPIIEDCFLFNSKTDEIALPVSRLLFTHDNKVENNNPQRDVAFLPGFAQGLQNEFQKHDYGQAIKSYQAAFSNAKNRNLKGEILNAIARTQKKAGNFSDAIQSYQKLSGEFSEVFSSNGIPLKLAAQIELGFIYGALKDTLKSVQHYLTAYHDLFQGTWSLEQSRYEFWSHTLNDSLHKIFQDENSSFHFVYFDSFKTIQDEESQHKKTTRRLLKFQTEAGNLISRKFLSRPGSDSYRFGVSLDDQDYFISLVGPMLKELNDFFGILWRRNLIQDSLLFFLTNENLPDDHISWIISDDEKQVISQSENYAAENTSLLVTTSFVDNFPNWTLALYRQNPNLIEDLLSSRRSIYFYIFMLIAGILAFGLFLSIRSVSHELEFVKLKSDFVSSVSHELKSPLTSIRQLAEMLQTGRVPTEERRQKYYDVIVEQSKRLSLMISNVLDFAKMEERKKQFKFESTDMGQFLREAIAGIQQQVSHQEFEINVNIATTLPTIAIDRNAISQAITNLLDNAIKYSDLIKTVNVGAFQKDGNLHISVQDFGVGIDKEDMAKIFDRFYRGTNEFIRSKKGSGLGLTLVKQIIQAHHGAIEIASEPGKGSTFTIRLPI
ncbi:ATP-binding protein, partial [candidate division KSB1 bacterium]|nr:ATP-binding protein [candidate division KSB1 bacterium]